MNKKNIALIGCGAWGLNFARVISQNENSELFIVCDKDASKIKNIKKLFPYIKYTENYTDVVNNPSVDGVVVATNVEAHYEIVKHSLEKGKHVLCEKPITKKIKEAIELKDISEKNNLILMIGHIFLYNDGIINIKKFLDNNFLGDIKYINFKRTGLGPIRNDVNVIWDLATHDISILLYLLKRKPVNVTAFAKSFLQKGIEDVAYIYLEFENNIFANIHVSWIEPIKQRIITLVGSDKMLVFDDVSIEEKIKIYDKGVSYQTFSGDFGTFQLSIRDGEITIPNIKYNEPLKTEFDCFISHINKQTKPLSDAHFAIEVLNILDLAQKSINNNNVKITL